MSTVKALLIAMILGGAAQASAQEQAQDPSDHLGVGSVVKSFPADSGYGSQPLPEEARFAKQIGPRARVDRRGELSPLAGRHILAPSAYIAPAGTFTLSTISMSVYQVAYSVKDTFQVHGGGAITFDSAYGHAGATWGIYDSRDVKVSAMPFAVYRAGQVTPTRDEPASDWGAGLGLMSDINLTDNLVLSAGLMGYATILYSGHRDDYSTCGSRSEYLDGACIDTNPERSLGPGGGHWLASYLGLTYYALDSLFFTLELVTGVTWGSFLATESLMTRNPGPEVERFTEGKSAFGVPPGRGIYPGVGVAWSNGRFGAQMAFYAMPHTASEQYRAEDFPFAPLPVLTMAYQF